MATRTDAVTAPYAVLEARRPRRPPLAVVFGRVDHPRDELMVTIDPTIERARVVLHVGDFEGEAVAPVVVRHLSPRTCTATMRVTLRGINRRTERGESFEVSLAATWSLIGPGEGARLDLAGTALAFGGTGEATLEFEAIRRHEFNHLDPLVAFDPGSSSVATTKAAPDEGSTTSWRRIRPRSRDGGGRVARRRPGYWRRGPNPSSVPAVPAA